MIFSPLAVGLFAWNYYEKAMRKNSQAYNKNPRKLMFSGILSGTSSTNTIFLYTDMQLVI